MKQTRTQLTVLPETHASPEMKRRLFWSIAGEHQVLQEAPTIQRGCILAWRRFTTPEDEARGSKEIVFGS